MILKAAISLQLAFFISAALVQSKGAAQTACDATQIALRIGPSGSATGHQLTELIFKNVSKNRCSLDAAKLVFWRMKPEPRRTRGGKGASMPTRVFRNNSVNADGVGVPAITMDAARETALTMDTANGTGYDEQRVCATQIRVGIVSQSKPLLDFASIACDERIFVSGFHAVRE